MRRDPVADVLRAWDEWRADESFEDPWPKLERAIEALRADHRGAVERAEKAEADVARLTRALAATEAELRYAAGLDDDDDAVPSDG